MCSLICQIEEVKARPWDSATDRVLRVMDEIVLRDSNTEAAVEARCTASATVHGKTKK